MTGMSGGRDDRALLLRPQVIRVSLWAVLGLWLARRLTRLLLLIVRSPAAMTATLVQASRALRRTCWNWVSVDRARA